MPKASQVFLQTHVWPLLWRDQAVQELHLQLLDAAGQRVPVMVNAEIGFDPQGHEQISWVFFVARQRSKFEAELLAARQQATEAVAALQARERFLRTITDAVPGLVSYWDAELICRFANSSHAEWYADVPESPVGLPMPRVIGQQAFERKRSHVQAALRGEAQRFEVRHDLAPDSYRYALTHFIPDRDRDGRVQGFYVLSVDVTRLKHAEQELRLADSIVRNASEAIMVSDQDGFIVSVNPAFTQATGFEASQAIGRHESIVQLGAHAESLAAQNEQAKVWRGEAWATRQDGTRFLAFRAISSMPAKDDAPQRFVTIFTDVTERWLRDERVRHLALHDPLTDLPNRILLTERLGRLMAMSEREQRSIAVMFMDLDGFKAVNDSLGHAAGDELLRKVAQAMRELVRDVDTVARFGGDEFVVLLDQPRDKTEVAAVAQRIITAVGRPFAVAGSVVNIGLSIGISQLPGTAADAEALISEADAALYAVKAAGKNGFRFFAELTL
ncbi:MAG: diguanylate cyclase domain-containing protein [Inhella sp.]